MPPTCSDVASCTIVDDPHITVFDKAQVSLLSLGRGHGARLTNDDPVLGDVWLVQSRFVSIQARYLPDATLSEKNSYVKAIAVGGPFIRNATLIVGAYDAAVTWNGQAILEPQVLGRRASSRSMSTFSTFQIPDLVKARQSRSGVVVAELPLGVNMTISRKRRHVDVVITMPPLEGGQEGLCGNFNGLAGDDSLGLVEDRSDPRVPLEFSLFSAATPKR